MEIDSHTAHIHIPSAEELKDNIEQSESEKSIEKIVKEVLKDLH